MIVHQKKKPGVFLPLPEGSWFARRVENESGVFFDSFSRDDDAHGT